jgi:hypothetical protein
MKVDEGSPEKMTWSDGYVHLDDETLCHATFIKKENPPPCERRVLIHSTFSQLRAMEFTDSSASDRLIAHSLRGTDRS